MELALAWAASELGCDAENARGVAGDDRIIRNIFGDDTAGADDSALTDG